MFNNDAPRTERFDNAPVVERDFRQDAPRRDFNRDAPRSQDFQAARAQPQPRRFENAPYSFESDRVAALLVLSHLVFEMLKLAQAFKHGCKIINKAGYGYDTQRSTRRVVRVVLFTR